MVSNSMLVDEVGMSNTLSMIPMAEIISRTNSQAVVQAKLWSPFIGSDREYDKRRRIGYAVLPKRYVQ